MTVESNQYFVKAKLNIDSSVSQKQESKSQQAGCLSGLWASLFGKNSAKEPLLKKIQDVGPQSSASPAKPIDDPAVKNLIDTKDWADRKSSFR